MFSNSFISLLANSPSSSLYFITAHKQHILFFAHITMWQNGKTETWNKNRKWLLLCWTIPMGGLQKTNTSITKQLLAVDRGQLWHSDWFPATQTHMQHTDTHLMRMCQSGVCMLQWARALGEGEAIKSKQTRERSSLPAPWVCVWIIMAEKQVINL